ncbi:MAG: hypothetical protein NT067_02545 [Candidatus Diapherotrites archaeon]|nr:hypothetical protein [Candidatus Diapherotrites archaeon]
MRINNEDTMLRLAVTKDLFNSAYKQELEQSESGRLIAVLLYDTSVENLLGCILSSFPRAKKKKNDFESFDRLWERTNETLKISSKEIGKKYSLPKENDIKKNRQIRNSAQHEGQIPDVTLVQRVRVHTKEFLGDVIKNVFGLSLEEVSLALLIDDIKVRKKVQEAISLMKKGEFESSMGASAIAFELAKQEEKKRIHGHSIWSTVSCPSLDDKYDEIERELSSLVSDIEGLFDEISTELEILKLQIDYKKYRHFKKLTPTVRIMQKPESYEISTQRTFDKRNYNRDNALFCVNFVIDTALKWQSFKIPSLIEPRQIDLSEL